jgi:hypothetical protein
MGQPPVGRRGSPNRAADVVPDSKRDALLATARVQNSPTDRLTLLSHPGSSRTRPRVVDGSAGTTNAPARSCLSSTDSCSYGQEWVTPGEVLGPD